MDTVTAEEMSAARLITGFVIVAWLLAGRLGPAGRRLRWVILVGYLAAAAGLVLYVMAR